MSNIQPHPAKGPKKALGQHFLTAPSFARRIAEAIPAGPEDNLLEIGPGCGALSVFLKDRFPCFHLVELDRDVIERLRLKLGQGSYTIHIHDILDFDFSIPGFPLHVVGNLPYSIGAMIIRKTLLYGNNILSCTFMVQREVAERIVSPPHVKTNGFLSIFCQFFGKPKIHFHVPPGAFFPPPSVDSSVFQIVIDPDLESKLPAGLREDFFAFVSRGFSMRRKQLPKILGESGSGGITKERYAAFLDKMGLPVTSRPEDLGIDEWLELYRLSKEAV